MSQSQVYQAEGVLESLSPELSLSKSQKSRAESKLQLKFPLQVREETRGEFGTPDPSQDSPYTLSLPLGSLH